jgi:hypothetical protein
VEIYKQTHLTFCHVAPFDLSMSRTLPSQHFSLSLKRTLISLGGMVVAVLLTFFAIHLSDCHVFTDTHEVASSTRTVELTFGVMADHKVQFDVGAADGGTKQHLHVALAAPSVQHRIAVVQDARPAETPIAVGKNTALAHHKLTSLLI